MSKSETTAAHEYPSNYKPGAYWATDAAWEILDTIKPGTISTDIRCLLAGMIAGRLMREEKRSRGPHPIFGWSSGETL